VRFAVILAVILLAVPAHAQTTNQGGGAHACDNTALPYATLTQVQSDNAIAPGPHPWNYTLDGLIQVTNTGQTPCAMTVKTSIGDATLATAYCAHIEPPGAWCDWNYLLAATQSYVTVPGKFASGVQGNGSVLIPITGFSWDLPVADTGAEAVQIEPYCSTLTCTEVSYHTTEHD